MIDELIKTPSEFENNFDHNLDIIPNFIKLNYSFSSVIIWCSILRDVECEDVINKYQNPVLIHKGGQRVVYRVDHPRYGKVALKIGYYNTPTTQDGWELERIEREIDILKHIDSPYYPKNYDFQKISNNRYFILEEFVDSPPLAQCLDKFRSLLKQ